jgi:alkylation response protein AidB-like acyl-CoA dehydrogenase
MIAESFAPPLTLPAPAMGPDWSPVTHRLGLAPVFDRFASTAAERDVAGRPIHAETTTLKAAGFGALRLGPDALSLPDLFRLARDLATADPNIAHVFRNHFFAVESHGRSPDAVLSARILRLAGEGAIFGVAYNEVSTIPAGGIGHLPAARLTRDGAGFRLTGRKIYSTGNLYADHLLVSAGEAETGTLRQVLVPARAEGVGHDDDWDGFGQKLTGSGTTVFDRVYVDAADVFAPPQRPEGAPFLHCFTFHQVYLTTAISGIVNRIFHDALEVVRGRSRNFYHALAERPRDEPELQSAIGRIAAWRAAVEAVTDRAAAALDLAWAGANGPDAVALSTAASLAAAEAKVVTDETAASLAGLLIDVSSGSGVTVTRALDRHWRNIKVISSHNPRLYKERILGDHYLNATALPTGAFF